MPTFTSMDPNCNVRLSCTDVFIPTISEWLPFSNPSIVFFSLSCGVSLKTVLLGKTRACSENVLFLYNCLWFGLLSRHLLLMTRSTRTCIFISKRSNLSQRCTSRPLNSSVQFLSLASSFISLTSKEVIELSSVVHLRPLWTYKLLRLVLN